MKKATFFFRNGGILITEIDDAHTGQNIGQRLSAGGYLVGRDSFWDKAREIPINLKDISAVIIEEAA